MLAKRCHISLNDLLDDWDERAACRTYLGGYTLEEANELAFQDIEKQYAPQGDMFEEAA